MRCDGDCDSKRGALYGAILVTEYGLVSEGRTLARSLIDNAFGVAALRAEPEKFVRMLRSDSAVSVRSQAKFAKEKLNTTKANRNALHKAIEAIGMHERMDFLKLAGMGPLLRFYLNYQRLSDGAAHISVTSLRRHMRKGPEGVDFTWGVGSDTDNASTLSIAIMAALAVGIGLTEVFADSASNQVFASLVQRCEAIPPADPI